MNATLTDTERDVLADCEAWRGYAFTAEDLYPARNNQDNAKRRTVHRLAQKGMLVQDDPLFLVYHFPGPFRRFGEGDDWTPTDADDLPF